MQQQQQQPQAQVTTTTSFFENGVKSPTAPAPAPPLVVHTPLSPPEGFPRSVFGTGSPRSVFGSGSSSPNAGHSGPAFTTARRGAPRSSVGLTGRRPTTTDYVMLYRQSYTAQDLSKTQQGIVVPVPPVPISPAPLPPGLQQQQQQEQQPPQRSSQPPNASFSLSKTQSGVLSPERKVIITTKYQPMIRSKYQQQQQLQPQQKRQQYYYSQQNAQKTPLSQSPSVCLQESPKPLGSSPALDSKISVLEKHVNDQNEFIRKLQSENAALKETAERLRKANGKPVNAHAYVRVIYFCCCCCCLGK